MERDWLYNLGAAHHLGKRETGLGRGLGGLILNKYECISFYSAKALLRAHTETHSKPHDGLFPLQILGKILCNELDKTTKTAGKVQEENGMISQTVSLRAMVTHSMLVHPELMMMV